MVGMKLQLKQILVPQKKKHITNGDRSGIRHVIRHLDNIARVIYIPNSRDRNENILHGKLVEDIEILRKVIGEEE